MFFVFTALIGLAYWICFRAMHGFLVYWIYMANFWFALTTTLALVESQIQIVLCMQRQVTAWLTHLYFHKCSMCPGCCCKVRSCLEPAYFLNRTFASLRCQVMRSAVHVYGAFCTMVDHTYMWYQTDAVVSRNWFSLSHENLV